MAVRTFLIYLCICVALFGCKNEPYESFPLGITSLVNNVSNQTTTFRYHDKQLYTFFSSKTSDTVANMLFHYQNGQIVYITLDSTKASLKKSFFYYFTEATVDSTYFFGADTVLTSVRSITYNGSTPATVRVQTWGEDAETGDPIFTDEIAELEWTDENVTHLAVSDQSTGEKIPLKSVEITHDDEFSMYTDIDQYIYTLSLTELYWLSKNNPTTFDDGSNVTTNIFWYNRLGYPAGYQSPTGTTYGVSYKQIR